MSLNLFLIFTILAIITLGLVTFFEEDKTRKTSGVCFLVLSLIILCSYWCFLNYSHSKKDTFYKNTDSCVLELEGVEFSKGKTLSLCSNTGDSALWKDKAGELVLHTGRDGCFLESSKLDQPLFISDKKDSLLFHLANISDSPSIQSGDILTICDIKHHKNILSLQYKIEKKKEKIFKKKKTHYLFIFDYDSTGVDTVDITLFKKGDNLHHLLTEGSGQWLPMDVLPNCYLVRNHFAIDKGKDPTDKSLRLFCNRLVANDSIRFYINGHEINPSPSSTRHSVDGNFFFYGLGTNRSNICSVKYDSTKVHLYYRTPLRYYFPKDTLSGRMKLFITTDIQEIIDRHESFDYFYQFMPNQAKNSVYSASGILSYYSGNANISMKPAFLDLNGDYKDDCYDSIEVNTDTFLLYSKSQQKHSDKLADVSYQLRIHDFRTDSTVYQQSGILYVFLLLLFASIYATLILKSNHDVKLFSRKIYIETTVYLVLMAFLTVRQIMLWRLQSFPPIKNVGTYEMNQFLNKWNFWGAWIAIYILLCIRLLLNFDIPKRIRKWCSSSKKFNNLFNRIKDRSTKVKERLSIKLQSTKLYNKIWGKSSSITFVAIFIPVISAILCLGIFYIGKQAWPFLKTSVTILIFCISSSILLFHLFNSPNRKLLFYLSLALNIGLFFLLSFIFEAGFILPFAGFISLLFVFMLFYEKEKHAKLALFFIALALSFLTFSHLIVAKNVARTLGIKSHRMAARMEAMVYTPTELFSDPKVKFQDKENYMQDILNATSNYWFIGNHLKYRDETLNKEHRKFQPVQEYTQKGVSYITQTRDLSVLRYLCFEHGMCPIFCLCFLLFLLFIVVASHSKIRGNTANKFCWLPSIISLFVLIYALYLALVNVNAVVFVGLDFPFLTLTSKWAPCSLILFFFVIIWHFNSNEPISTVSNSSSGNTGSALLKPLLLPICLTGLVLLFVVLPIINRNFKAIEPENSYYVSMEPLVSFIRNDFNPKLIEYQENHKEQFKSKDRKQIEQNLHNAVQALLNNPVIFKNCRSEDTAFIHSVFTKAPSYSDTKYLVYARKSSDHYIFSGNSEFNHLKPIFEKQHENNWCGDLLAANVRSQNRPTINGKSIETIHRKNNSDGLMYIGDSTLIEKNIFVLPGRYCYDNQSRLIYHPFTDNVPNKYVKYNILPQGDVSQKIENRIACQIGPKDILIVKYAGNEYTINVGESENHYLAKRIHYNGQHQVVYPFVGDFIFATNFDNMLTNFYKKRNDEHPNGFDHKKDPVQISIDYDLTTDVMQYCRNNIHYGSGITVTAIDGNGCVRLLGDYDPHAEYIDPNNEELLDELQTNALLNGDKLAERNALANRNLSKLTKGPGSTIKPIYYAAIASEANLNWPHFYVFGTPRATGSSWTFFGDYSLETVSNEVKNKEANEAINGPMNVADFIKKSNNYFLGSLLMLGTYPSKIMESPGLCLDPVPTGHEAQYFPSFNINGTYYKFRGKFIPSLFEYLPASPEGNAALENGLRDNFRYMVSYNTSGDERYRQEMVKFLGIEKTAEYVFPEKAEMVRKQFVQGKETDIFNDHLNLVHGGNPLQISPLIMAESFLRIVKDNNAEDLLTYDDRNAAPTSNFLCSDRYGGGQLSHNVYWESLRPTLFTGLWNVVHEPGGTLYKRYNKELILYNFQNYLAGRQIYLYAKTGTCNSGANHHYAFILSNQKLHGNEPIDHKALKVYVVYFGFYDTSSYGHSNTQPYIKEIINKIINSETFKKYWYEQ